MNKQLPPERRGTDPLRGHGRRACFTRVEAVMRSCAMVGALAWAAGGLRG